MEYILVYSHPLELSKRNKQRKRRVISPFSPLLVYPPASRYWGYRARISPTPPRSLSPARLHTDNQMGGNHQSRRSSNSKVKEGTFPNGRSGSFGVPCACWTSHATKSPTRGPGKVPFGSYRRGTLLVCIFPRVGVYTFSVYCLRTDRAFRDNVFERERITRG